MGYNQFCEIRVNFNRYVPADELKFVSEVTVSILQSWRGLSKLHRLNGQGIVKVVKIAQSTLSIQDQGYLNMSRYGLPSLLLNTLCYWIQWFN